MSNAHMVYIDGVADFEHQLRASLNDLGIKVGTSPASEVATLNAITYKLSAEGLAARIRADDPQQVFITTSPIAQDYEQLTVSWKKGDGFTVFMAQDWGGSRRWVIHDQLLKDQRIAGDDAWKTDSSLFRGIAEDYLQDADRAIGNQALGQWLDQIAYDLEDTVTP